MVTSGTIILITVMVMISFPYVACVVTNFPQMVVDAVCAIPSSELAVTEMTYFLLGSRSLSWISRRYVWKGKFPSLSKQLSQLTVKWMRSQLIDLLTTWDENKCYTTSVQEWLIFTRRRGRMDWFFGCRQAMILLWLPPGHDGTIYAFGQADISDQF